MSKEKLSYSEIQTIAHEITTELINEFYFDTEEKYIIEQIIRTYLLKKLG